MTPLFRPGASVNAAILKGLAIFSVLGCVAGLAAVAVVDWSMLRLHHEFVAKNGAGAADALSAETPTMILLNGAVVIAVVLNLIAVRLMLRRRHAA